jgi:hypothetical protein
LIGDWTFSCEVEPALCSTLAEKSCTDTACPTLFKLLGADEAETCSGSASAGYICLSQFQAGETGDIVKFRLHASGPGNVMVAMYNDIGGEPGGLLNWVDSTAVIPGWNDIWFPSTRVTRDEYYWLAYSSDVPVTCFNYSSGVLKFTPAPYGTPFPDPAPQGLPSNSLRGLVAGWGCIVPLRVINLPASSIASTSARLNGDITGTGGEDPTVYIYWGDEDGGKVEGAWDTYEDMGTKEVGTFYADISSLTPNTPYYYRCFAYNSDGDTWADITTSFTTIHPGTPGDANGDGVINVLDMTKVARIILEWDTQTSGADCNQDSSINVRDITCVARRILGL